MYNTSYLGSDPAGVSVITVTQVKNGPEALSLMSQVIAALGLGDDDSKKHSFSLWARTDSSGGLTVKNIVKMFQQMREWAQEKGNNAVDQKVLDEAEWFYYNVENPSAKPSSNSAGNTDLPPAYSPRAFYQKPQFWMYTGIGSVILIGGFLYFRNR